MDNILDNGMVLVQVNPERACELSKDSQWYGWLFMHHPDGQWVSCKKLNEEEIKKAKILKAVKHIRDGGHNIISKSGGVRCG